MTNQPRGSLYIGVTSDLMKRIWQHKNKMVKGHTGKYNLTQLVWYERHETAESAIKREKNMKEWQRAWKIRLIEESNPDWYDLSDDLIKRVNI